MGSISSTETESNSHICILGSNSHHVSHTAGRAYCFGLNACPLKDNPSKSESGYTTKRILAHKLNSKEEMSIQGYFIANANLEIGNTGSNIMELAEASKARYVVAGEEN